MHRNVSQMLRIYSAPYDNNKFARKCLSHYYIYHSNKLKGKKYDIHIKMLVRNKYKAKHSHTHRQLRRRVRETKIFDFIFCHIRFVCCIFHFPSHTQLKSSTYIVVLSCPLYSNKFVLNVNVCATLLLLLLPMYFICPVCMNHSKIVDCMVYGLNQRPNTTHRCWPSHSF